MASCEDALSLTPSVVYTDLIFFVNGKKVVEHEPDPTWTLLNYLRRRLRLCGTKYGCGEGGCGACTVMVSKYDRTEQRVVHLAVNACLTPVCSVHGQAVTTVEGIGSTVSELHPVQERIAKAHGSQCGFCTPGIVMSMYTLLRNNPKIQYEDINTALQGNLCRCTGYRPIIEGFKTFIEGWEVRPLSNETSKNCAMGKDCCKNSKIIETNKNLFEQGEELFDSRSFKPYDPSQEPIFPPELIISSGLDQQYLVFMNSSVTWYRPNTLEQLMKIKDFFPNCKIVVGNTEVGVEIKFKSLIYPVIASPILIKEMNSIIIHADVLEIGASVTLTEVQIYLEKLTSEGPAYKMRAFATILEMLNWFAGTQIRNVASIGGNIMTASPISDLNPIFMSCGAELNICSKTGQKRKVCIDESFFISYRQTNIQPNEIVVSVEIPFTNKLQYIKAYKQAKRREDDISIVTGAFNVEFVSDTMHKIKNLHICYGGISSTTFNAKKTSDALVDSTFDQNTLHKALNNLINEIKIDPSAPGGMVEFRKSLCLSMFFKFYLDVCIQAFDSQNGYSIPNNYLSATTDLENIKPKSSQYYEILNGDKKPSDSVGMPITHRSAFKQATGEAIYCDDMPTIEGELFLCLKFSSKSNARILSIDASKALAVEGVIAFFSAKDLNHDKNQRLPDEEMFSSEFVSSYGDILGALVAVDEATARRSVGLVKVAYEELGQPIITIEDAIQRKSYFPGYPKIMIKGDVEKTFREAEFVTEGYSRNGAQEHFYLETHSCFAIFKEDEVEIYSSSQNPAEISERVSILLGIPKHKVYAKVKRIGGGFGGKEGRATMLALPVAFAAHKLRRPIRSVMDRDEDMQATGHRHPMLIKYKVAHTHSGKITGAVFDIYNNAGSTLEMSGLVLDRASKHIDNCCYIPNVQVNGYVCKTNLPCNTSFRGFGAPQAMLATETMMRDIAQRVEKSYEEISKINMYREGDLTHFNQPLEHCTLGRCWEECVIMANYFKRKNEVDVYNRQSRWKKKGLSIVSTKFGISFGVDFLMQGGALVLIYTDGSVLITIGGIEMGQGLLTKMIQVASRALEIDISKIHISETATDRVPNSSSTAASISSDLYGMAVVDACTTLMKRLKPYKDNSPNGKWEDWVSAAYFERICLSATGFYAAPKIEYNAATNSGKLYEYFTYGVACSEVIIDCLTGDHQVLRTDIVMDLGESLNPAIDIGQIEGAFMQGYGFYTMEELVFSQTGSLYSKGPGSYKIPGFGDIPKEFNVSLLKGAPNPRAVYSSKAVGEPPLFLASSVIFAIKEAISSARRDAGVNPYFHLDAPATCAKIRMACVDHITDMVGPAAKDAKPWNVTA